ALTAVGSRCLSNAKSSHFACPFWKSTGRMPSVSTTSRRSIMQMSLFPKSGPEDSPAKTSQWLAWGRELDLEGENLDCFLNLLAYLKKVAPEFLSSRMF